MTRNDACETYLQEHDAQQLDQLRDFLRIPSVSSLPEHAGVVVRRLAESLMKHQVGASLGYAMRDINVNLQGAFDEADRSMYANKRARKAKRAAGQA